MKRTLRALLASGLCLGFGPTACAEITAELPAPRTPTRAGQLRAGASEGDITPPLGYATAGHSLEGSIAVGVWTRLKVRAIVIEDARGVPLVLAVCDLWAIPSGLVDAVADALADDPRTAHIGREHLILAATHTHHGPSHYASSRTYSGHAGTRGGFDPRLFEFLARTIAATIVRATTELEPATITRHRVAVAGVARNRSLPPFLANPDAEALLRANADLPGCPEVPLELRDGVDVDPCRAVDPLLDTLAIASTSDPARRIAVAAFFSVHATAMPNRAGLYNGDLFAIASQRAARAIATSDDPPPIVAVFNGAEGDVSPNWSRQGRVDTQVLGATLGEAIAASLDEPGVVVDGPVRVSFVRAPVADVRLPRGPLSTLHTADRAIPGRAMFGGAEDGRTRFHARGFREGVRKEQPSRDYQGHKRPALPKVLLAIGAPKRNFPRNVPLGVVRIGDLAMATLPGEFTTMMGRRIAASVAQASGTEAPVITIGLSGEYLSYFTTPEEYALQHYEGASTLYGPSSGNVIARHLAAIASSGEVRYDRNARYEPGPIRRAHRLPRSSAARRHREIARDMELTGLVAPLAIAYDGPPSRWRTSSGSTTPRVIIETRDADDRWSPLVVDHLPVDDERDAFVTYVTETTRNRWSWSTMWMSPVAPDPGQPLRARIVLQDGQAVCTPPFTIGQLRTSTADRPARATVDACSLTAEP